MSKIRHKRRLQVFEHALNSSSSNNTCTEFSESAFTIVCTNLKEVYLATGFRNCTAKTRYNGPRYIHTTESLTRPLSQVFFLKLAFDFCRFCVVIVFQLHKIPD